MQAIVLVGGRGTRLAPLTDRVPKPLLPVALQPLLARVITRLREAGVDDVVLSLGYRPDDFVAQFPDGMWNGVRVRYAVESEPLGTGGGIRFAAEVGAIDDTFVVVNGDVIASGSLLPLLALHRGRGAHATVALTEVIDPSTFGVVDAEPDGRVRAFVEKPAPGTAPSNLANAGAYVMEPAALAVFPDGASSVERDVFPVLARAGTLFATVVAGSWVDAGTLDGYLTANLAELGPACPALVDATATVAPDATLDRTIVGPGARIGAGVTLRDVVVLEDARIGDGATITHSIIGAWARIHTRARVRERIIGFDEVVAGDDLAQTGHAA